MAFRNIDELLALLIQLLLVPLVTRFIVAAWFVEILRQVRAGAFVAHLEDKINTVLGRASPALEWENWLRRHPEFIVRQPGFSGGSNTVTEGPGAYLHQR